MNVGAKWSGRVRKVALGIAFLGVVIGIGVAVAIKTTGTEIAKELERIRAAGFPVEVEDLNAFYTEVPEANNAALGVLRANEKFVRSGGLEGMSLPQGAQSLSPEFASVIADHLENNSETLGLLAEALKLKEARYPVVFRGTIETIPPHLSELKKLTHLLRYSAAHAATNGDEGEAFEAVRNGFRLAATLRNEPLMISEMVRISCVAITLNSLEFALHNVSFTDEQLKELDDVLQEAEVDCSRSRFRALAGERTLGIRGFDRMRTGKLAQPAPATGQERASAAVYKMLGMIERDEREYLMMMEGLIVAMTNGFPEATQRTEAFEQELTQRFSRGLRRFCVHTRGTFPALATSVAKEGALLTKIRCARTAIAIERYRKAEERLPDELNAVVPRFMSQLLRDPLKGELLTYVKTEAGYRITSEAAAAKWKVSPSTTFAVSREAMRSRN